MISKCSCVSEFQDERHGSGNRVFNKCKKQSSGQPYRCTVCAKVVMGAKTEDDKKK